MTRPEEVSMHPTMMMALATEVERKRQNERQKLHVRSQVLAGPRQGTESARASRLARRLIAGVSLRPRVS
jgi:hypothetical protein